MKENLNWAAFLAVLLLLGVGQAAEAGAEATPVLVAQHADPVALTVIMLVVISPFFVYGCYLHGKRKHEKEMAERISRSNSLDVYHHHDHYVGRPVAGDYHQLPPPPKRILVVRVIRWFFVRRR